MSPLIKWIVLLISIIVLSANQVSARQRAFEADTLTLLIDGLSPPFNEIAPGDSLLLQAGNRPYILIRNINGSPGLPIVIINHQGIVRINTDHYFGISFQHCSYFKITGTGDPDQFYGFQIERVSNGAGIGIGDGCSDFEADHLSISNTKIAGIYAKTDPDCSFNFTRDRFTQFNTLIHDNYIGNAGNEGMYIGSTKYFGQSINCAGTDTLLLPSLLSGVRVYNNIVENSGWDGIQISSASFDCQVYNNVVKGDSQAEQPGQMSGIIIGGGSKCDCYNNYIADGKGNGIESHGLGGYKIFNNIILNAGKNFHPGDYQQMKYGIFITDVSTIPGNAYLLMHNDIINPKSDGIRLTSTLSSGNLIASNLIVNPGNYDFYQNGGTLFDGEDSYIMIPDEATEVAISNNFLTRDILEAGIDTSHFTINSNSPLIDMGYNASGMVSFDFYNHPRPAGAAFDIGAFEFDAQYLGLVNDNVQPEILIYPNPAGSQVCFTNILKEGNDKLTVRIYTPDGRQVMETEILPVQNKGTYLLNVDILKSGLYFYSVIKNDRAKSGKLLIVH